MAALTNDLWGEIQTPGAVRTPVSILKEQASILGKKTNQLLRGRVRTQALDRGVHHYFDIVVPSLDDYTYELLVVAHGMADFYPVTVQGSKILDTEEDFVNWLKIMFTSPSTQKIVRNLLAQANS